MDFFPTSTTLPGILYIVCMVIFIVMLKLLVQENKVIQRILFRLREGRSRMIYIIGCHVQNCSFSLCRSTKRKLLWKKRQDGDWYFKEEKRREMLYSDWSMELSDTVSASQPQSTLGCSHKPPSPPAPKCSLCASDLSTSGR